MKKNFMWFVPGTWTKRIELSTPERSIWQVMDLSRLVKQRTLLISLTDRGNVWWIFVLISFTAAPVSRIWDLTSKSCKIVSLQYQLKSLYLYHKTYFNILFVFVYKGFYIQQLIFLTRFSVLFSSYCSWWNF